jgi:pre-mRNA-processing factor 17
MASLLGADYNSSDDDATTPQVATATPATKVVAAPEVNTEGSSAYADDAG